MNNKALDIKRKLSIKAVVAFVLSLLLCSVLIFVSIRNRYDVEETNMEQLVMEKSNKINEVITKLLFKTYTLSAFIEQNNGEMEDFDRIAATVVDDPAIMNVLIAPGGIVSDVYPLAGNQQVLGYDLLGEGDGNKEAILAKEMGQLVFGGPFTTVQGTEALVGRLPVYIRDQNGQARFWGLSSITLHFPQALDGAELDILQMQGFAYELWRISPDTDERQVIASTMGDAERNARYVEMPLEILNAQWHFRISPLREWYQYPETWIMVVAALSISLLVGSIAQNNAELHQVKVELEKLVTKDFLTGILNRRGLFEELEPRLQDDAFVLYFMDLNNFKHINDTYGHHQGDLALAEFCRRFSKSVGPGDLFARVSGDEFVYCHPVRAGNEEAAGEEAEKFWQKIRQEFAKPILDDVPNCFLSFSTGIARYPQDGSTIDELIKFADADMYFKKSHPE